MPRYFLEVAYRGTEYSGFQVQDNARSIQSEVERALGILFRTQIVLTGSSRTDSGVHARQNFFHFDYEGVIEQARIYNLNALLPGDIACRRLEAVGAEAHCRFDATAREYRYYIYREKDPFIADRAFFYPYKVDLGRLQAAADVLLLHRNFEAFSKRNTQVKTFACRIDESGWTEEKTGLVYRVVANRFLRGMVRGLVGTMLQVGRGNMSVEEFEQILLNGDNQKVDFSTPGHGLFLFRVYYPDSVFPSGE